MDDAGNVIGAAWPSEGEVALLVDPDHRSLDAELIAWGEGHRRWTGDPVGSPVGLEIWAFDGDERTTSLEQHGYELTENAIRYLRQRIVPPVPDPVLPTGYVLRHVEGEDDLEHRVAVHRDAFAPSRMTVAKHRAVMDAPTYRSDLDLVVVAPDGSFAAFAIVWHDPTNRIGVFEPVGCHTVHRRRGLARAIMREGLKRLAGLGAESAFVGTVTTNPASAGLYASAGFEPFKVNRAWKKELA